MLLLILAALCKCNTAANEIQIGKVVARIVHEEHLMVQLLLCLLALGRLDELVSEMDLFSLRFLMIMMRFRGAHHV